MPRSPSPLAFLVAFAIALAAPLVAAEVPTTEVIEVHDQLHGTEIVDPYRWLEGSAAPEVEDDPELDARVSAWTDTQNAYTREVLDGLPGREALEARLRELLEVAAVASPEVRRNLYFTWRREGDQAQWVVYVQEGPDGEPRNRNSRPSSISGPSNRWAPMTRSS